MPSSPSRPRVLLVVAAVAALGTGGYLMSNCGSKKAAVATPFTPPPVGSNRIRHEYTSVTDAGVKVVSHVDFVFGKGRSDAGPEERPRTLPARSADEQCASGRQALVDVSTAAARNGQVPDDPELHRRAARIWDLDSNLEVAEGVLKVLKDVRADPARLAQFGNGDPVALDQRIKMQGELVEKYRAEVGEERAQAERKGYKQLAEPEGAGEVIMAVLWRDIGRGAQRLLRACDDPKSPERVNVDKFLASAQNVIADAEGGHGVGPRAVVRRLLEEDKQ